jgi:hypothetical protein
MAVTMKKESSEMLRSAALENIKSYKRLVRTEVSEERIALIIRVERINKLVTTSRTTSDSSRCASVTSYCLRCS